MFSLPKQLLKKPFPGFFQPNTPKTSPPDGAAVGVLLTLGGAVLFSNKAVLVKLIYLLNAGQTGLAPDVVPIASMPVASMPVASMPIDAITIMAFRMAFALPCYGLVALWMGRRGGFGAKGMGRRYLLPTLALGLLGYYVSMWFDLTGLSYISAGLERLILFIYPTLVVVMLALYERTRLSGRVILALLATYAGIALAFAGQVRHHAVLDAATPALGTANDQAVWIGSALVLAAAFCFALFNLGAGAVLKKVDSALFTALSMAMAGSASVLHYLVVYGPVLPDLGENWGPFLGLTASMALFCTVLPSFMIAAGIARLGSGRAVIIGNVGPISTLLLAAILLGEPLGLAQCLGAALVIGGVLAVGKSRRS